MRIVSIDQPGIGISSPYPKGQRAKLSDWPNDVKELADHLCLKQYYILVEGSATSYALIRAHALPKDELRGVAILALMWPYKKALKPLPWWIRLSVKLGAEAP